MAQMLLSAVTFVDAASSSSSFCLDEKLDRFYQYHLDNIEYIFFDASRIIDIFYTLLILEYSVVLLKLAQSSFCLNLKSKCRPNFSI